MVRVLSIDYALKHIVRYFIINVIFVKRQDDGVHNPEERKQNSGSRGQGPVQSAGPSTEALSQRGRHATATAGLPAREAEANHKLIGINQWSRSFPLMVAEPEMHERLPLEQGSQSVACTQPHADERALCSTSRALRDRAHAGSNV